MAKWIEERIGWVSLAGGETATVASILSQMKDINNRYGSRYRNLHFKKVQDCGHPFHCECERSYRLHGSRKVEENPI